MESFYRTHRYLVEHTEAPIRRGLMDEIDWNDRLIGIKGTRGVGKTTNQIHGKNYDHSYYDSDEQIVKPRLCSCSLGEAFVKGNAEYFVVKQYEHRHNYDGKYHAHPHLGLAQRKYGRRAEEGGAYVSRKI